MWERISRRERLDLFIAWLAISFAFTLVFVREELVGKVDVPTFLIFFAIAAVTVGIGFVAHEMAHKFTAMRFGYWAEFRKDNLMLLFAVLLAGLVGVVFAAPGATLIYGSAVSRSENGKISAAGPVTNLLLCIPFVVLLLVAKENVLLLLGTIGLQVNAMLAAFNMLPVSVLDGRKVLAWNPAIFVALIAASFILVYLSLTRFFM
ncbi:MAG: peptidase M50 [Methanomicrobiales archaeon]|jgi:Zn-dependent protease|nr:peptidase M50 [Methanomicrobiales archaeon]